MSWIDLSESRPPGLRILGAGWVHAGSTIKRSSCASPICAGACAKKRSTFARRTLARGRPLLVKRLGRVRRNLQVRAVMIGIVPRIVRAMFRHELHDLERALPAADVRQQHVRLPLCLHLCLMDPKAVPANCYLQGTLDL